MNLDKQRTGEKKHANITFQQEGSSLDVDLGSTILEAARRVGIDIHAPCGGLGLCGRCRVVVIQSKDFLNSPTDAESHILSPTELNVGFRLACQCAVSAMGSLVVTVPTDSRVGHQQVVVQGFIPKFNLSPIVTRTLVRLETDDLNRTKAYSELLTSYLKKQGYQACSLTIEAMKRLPDVIHDGTKGLSIALWREREVLSIEPNDRRSRLLGFALDIGTTKLAGFLIDLESSELLASSSLPNPQISFGEDLISRVTYWSQEQAKARELQRAVIDGVNRLINDACKEAGVSKTEIYDLTVAGNTVMHHIFFGISPKYVALSPFPVAVNGSFDVRSKDLDVNVNPTAYIHALPTIAGFVGADTVAGILATEIYKSEEICMLIDIGTNAEIVVGNKDEVTCCSSPAGPAFEGRHLKHGMRSSSGAIDTVWIDPEDHSVGYKTVDNAKPRGICGSGIIDVVSQMFKTHLISRTGNFNEALDISRIRTSGKETEFVIAWHDESEGPEDITITERDVQEVLLAKAAIYSGTAVLLKRLNLTPTKVEKLFLAGAFGTYVDLTNSLIIGMYPEIPVSRARFVGNTSGSGARMVLMSSEIRLIADKIARSTKYLELATDPLFEKEFTNALWLPHKHEERFPTVMNMIEKH